MPWTGASFKKHKKGMGKAQSSRGAKIANNILASCLKGGKKQADCERIAIATALKNISRGGKRKV